MTDSMGWFWIAIALTIPTFLAAVVALPFWLKASENVGSIIAAAIVFVACIAMIGREYIHVERATAACLDAGRICSFHPEPFTRFCIYGFIALIEAFALFAIGLAIEERKRRNSYAPEWRC